MKHIFFLLALLGNYIPASSQSKNKITYQQLQEFEGQYEFVNHTTLLIVVSPKDSTLYSIIGQSKYPLYAAGPDLFENSGKEKVQFIRDAAHQVTAYTVSGQTFKLLQQHITLPREMWHSRTTPYTGFSEPAHLNDGLATGKPEKSGLDTALLSTMMRKIINGTYPNIHSVIIIKDGKLVFEEYFYEYNRDSLQELRSASKSFVSALTGIAIDKGYIKSVHDPVLPFFPEYNVKDAGTKKNITVEHLLANQSGLDCDYANEKSAGNEITMDYSDDWVKFTLDLPVIDTPGGRGMYCSGNPITLGRIIEKTTKQALPDFANQYLFQPLGIRDFKWRFKPDQSSAETYCQLYLSPRNMAKFGQLYLQKGAWNGKQVVSADWVKASFDKHSIVQNVNYGYLWWLKYLDADGVRYNGKAAQGNGGQKIYIWEEQNMVTVITGGNYNTTSPSDELIRKYILPAFNKK
jgi:CubicO group peptidase (beta-lactamase class C family)